MCKLKKELKNLLNDDEFLADLEKRLVGINNKEENVKSEDFERLEKRIAHLEKQNEEYKKDVANIYDLSKKLESKRLELKNENKDFEQEVENLRDEKDKLNELVNKLKSELEKANEASKVVIEEHSQLKDEILSVKAKNESLISDYRNDVAKFKGLEEELNVLQNKHNEEQVKNSELEGSNLDLSKELDEQKALLIQAKQEAELISEKANTQENVNEQLRLELLTADTTIEEYQNIIAGKDEVISDNEKELVLLRPFAEWLDIYKLYDELAESTKESLNGIFKGQDILRFVYCGLQENNMENLWEYIKSEALNNKTENIESLATIFAKLFNSYNMTFEVPAYKMQEVTIGQEFDDYDHIRTSDSEPSGSIREVILYGYVNKYGKAIKKSIVRI